MNTLVLLGLGFAAVFALAFIVFALLEDDRRDAADRTRRSVVGLSTGAVGAGFHLTGALGDVGGELLGMVLGLPSIPLALLGLGQAAEVFDLSPGAFVVVAVVAFLLSKAVDGARG